MKSNLSRDRHVTNLLPAYVNRTLNDFDIKWVDGHLVICAFCRSELELWQEIADAQRRFARATAPSSTPDTALLHRVRTEIAVPEHSSQLSKKPRSLKHAALPAILSGKMSQRFLNTVAAAALLILLVGGFLVTVNVARKQASTGFAGILPAQPAATQSKTIGNTTHVTKAHFTVVGTKIYDPAGHIFVPKGVNVNGPDWVWSRETAQDASLIADTWGFNLVRADSIIGTPRSNSNNDIDALVTTFTHRHVVVLFSALDYQHSYPTSSQLQTLLQWQTSLAERYKENPYVWFSSLVAPDTNQNEPPDHTAWITLNRQIVEAIRNTGNSSPIVLEGASEGQDAGDVHPTLVNEQWSTLLSGDPLQVRQSGSRTYDNLIVSIYAFEQYGFDTGPAGQTSWRDDSRIADYIDRVQAKNQMPLLISVFGASNHGYGTLNATKSMYAAVQPRSVGRIVWHWYGGDLNTLTNTDNPAGGWRIDNPTHPTNLTRLGQMVWNDMHFPG